MALIRVGQTEFDARIAIFDKDGTLIDFTGTWLAIVDLLLLRMADHVTMSGRLREKVQEVLGVSLDRAEVDPGGALAMGTFAECYALLCHCLHQEGLRWDEAQRVVAALDEEVFQSEDRNRCVRPAQGAIEALARLKGKGLHVAVATNDKTRDALSDLLAIGAGPYIDMVVGADAVANPKPASDMVDKICGMAGSPPATAVLVGDTVMDASLGRNAGVGLVVGVLGIEDRRVLEEHVDVVIGSLDEIS